MSPSQQLAPDFGQRVRELRTRVFRWSQTELANVLGVRHATISNWEREKSIPSASLLQALVQQTSSPHAYLRWLRQGGELPAGRRAQGRSGAVLPHDLELPQVEAGIREELASVISEVSQKAVMGENIQAVRVLTLLTAMVKLLSAYQDAVRTTGEGEAFSEELENVLRA